MLVSPHPLEIGTVSLVEMIDFVPGYDIILGNYDVTTELTLLAVMANNVH